MAFKQEWMSIHPERANIGRLLLALYKVYGEHSPEVEQHAKYLANHFEENVIYTDKKRSVDKGTMYIVNAYGYLLVSDTREDLVEVNVPDSVCKGNNPLIGTDY